MVMLGKVMYISAVTVDSIIPVLGKTIQGGGENEYIMAGKEQYSLGKQFLNKQHNLTTVVGVTYFRRWTSFFSEEPEDPMKKLYGIDLPDWCTTGKDLPGVYKDVKDTVILNGAIDTGKLYTVLLASELQRDILGQLWSQVNKATPGQLNDMELRMILGLIALGQVWMIL